MQEFMVMTEMVPTQYIRINEIDFPIRHMLDAVESLRPAPGFDFPEVIVKDTAAGDAMRALVDIGVAQKLGWYGVQKYSAIEPGFSEFRTQMLRQLFTQMEQHGQLENEGIGTWEQFECWAKVGYVI